MMKQQIFTVVFMDLQMPRMCGQECVTKLRAWEKEIERKRQYIVALFSAVNFEREKSELITIGFNGAECKGNQKEKVLMHALNSRDSAREKATNNSSSPGKYVQPNGQNSESTQASQSSIDQNTSQDTVLLVDDMPSVIRLYRRRLEAMGLVVHSASKQT
mmetsp:Transcript_14217/g.19607  ORF Transcript_14217/g.19607 Transcript_14217/m.19607 type:complete len:160 (+) Transcript_14217:238-717(+)